MSQKNLRWHPTQHYSKNGKLDVLIRRKLQQQLPQIKANTARYISRDGPSDPIAQPPRKHSLSRNKIINSLHFNPIQDTKVKNFIVARQSLSPLLASDFLSDLYKSRACSTTLEVRKDRSDLHTYLDRVPNTQLQLQQVIGKVQQMLPEQLWLPTTPQLEGITLSTTSKQVLNSQLMYDYRKYHKQDYSTLEQWLDQTLKQTPPTYNEVYGVYMCCWKQYIRLAYVECASKGLLTEKLLYSTIRLTRCAISNHHTTLFAQFKEQSKDMNELKQRYNTRISTLQRQVLDLRGALTVTTALKKKTDRVAGVLLRLMGGVQQDLDEAVEGRKASQGQCAATVDQLMKLAKRCEAMNVVKFVEGVSGRMLVSVKQDYSTEVICTFSTVQENKQQKQVKNIDEYLRDCWAEHEEQFNIQWGDSREQGTQMENQQGVDVGCNTQHTANIVQKYENRIKVLQQDNINKQLENQRIHNSKKQITKEKEIIEKQIKQLKDNVEILLKKIEENKKNQLINMEMKMKQIEQINKKVEKLNLELNSMKIEIKQLNVEIMNRQIELNHKKSKYQQQKSNNITLVTQIMQIKTEKCEIQNKFYCLENKIKSLSPYLKNYLQFIDKEQFPQILLTVGAKIEEYLSEYVQKDATVFITK